MQATARAATPRRTHLAPAGVCQLVTLFRKNLRGYPKWKLAIFYVLRKANRLAATKLKLPVVLDPNGYWFEYQGVFDHIETAYQAIEQMNAEFKAQGINDVQFELTKNLPRNGILPKQTGRYLDQDYPNDYIREFTKEHTGPVMCPFKKSLCRPDDVMSRADFKELDEASAKLELVLNR